MAEKKQPAKKSAKSKSAISGDQPDEVVSTPLTKKPFPIVGLGASAGGLDALKSFFSEVTEKSAMAYIVVIHMAPHQPSMMPDLLQKVSCIPVLGAIDNQPVEPNHVYVIPPDKEIAIYNGKIQLLDLIRQPVTLPIDSFLKSLAREQRSKAAAVILSGTGSDGTLGIKEIKASDGLVLVQDEDSAGYDGMPRSAIHTGLVDMVLPPGKMPEKLVQYFTSHKAAPDLEGGDSKNTQNIWLTKVFAILRAQIGHDFSAYKVNTILRRISRRMGLNQIDNHERYVRFLRENPGEVETLFRELLIGVTHFFRDTGSFEILKTKILPPLFEKMADDATFRAWIPGCSTGEEVYSLAILLRECIDNIPKRINLQFFGTDIDKYAIDRAREGLYPENIATDVSKERLKRFFSKEGKAFRIRKEIRDCVVFSVQDVIKDPPFSHLNLLCCRNLLIYLNVEAQKKLLPVFHYTLNPDGILVLGSSETIGGFTPMFAVLDKKWKIYRRLEIPQSMRQMIHFPSGPSTQKTAYEKQPLVPALQFDFAQVAQKAILDQFSPTAILVDANGQMLHIQGRTGKYLETPSGPPTQNLIDYARQGLRIELSAALRTARSSDQTVVRKKISVKTNGDVQVINLHVCPQRSPKELAGRFLVVFEDIETVQAVSGSDPEARSESPEAASRIDELEKELQINRESHQVTIEELESSNEELKSTNEELQSSNEELQSTNEELESSKEELQSLNEELQTVNAELHSKLEELSAVHDDMRNLLNSTEIATIFVDNDLRIRRFTQEAITIINLIETDIGRPIGHVVTNLTYTDMILDLTHVLKTLVPKVVEVATVNGDFYNMRIAPYRTIDNRIDGAVLAFTCVSAQKKIQDDLETAGRKMEAAWTLVRAIFDMNPEPLAVLNQEGKMVIFNTALSRLMHISPDAIEKIEAADFLTTAKDKADLNAKLKSALEKDRDFEINNFEMQLPEGEQRFTLHGRIIKGNEKFPYRILLQFKNDR